MDDDKYSYPRPATGTGYVRKRGYRIDATERQRLLIVEDTALSLRMAGLTLTAIADRLNYSNASGARKAIERALSRQPVPDVEHARALQNARIDRLIAGHWQHALAGDEDATKIVLRLLERQARLNGIDKPVIRTDGQTEENPYANITDDVLIAELTALRLKAGIESQVADGFAALSDAMQQGQGRAELTAGSGVADALGQRAEDLADAMTIDGTLSDTDDTHG